jgi:quinol monooxygenase YgiN
MRPIQWCKKTRRGEEVNTLVIIEWQTFKDEAKVKKYYEYLKTEPFRAHREALESEVKSRGWSAAPGHLVLIEEYESMEEFSKIWSDEEYQKKLIKLNRLVKNLSIRILRPAIPTPPE